MNERGSAGVVAVALGSVVLVVGLIVVGGAAMVSGRAHAQAAADAAALAAVAASFEKGGQPAAEARRFADLNGAELVSCSCPHDPAPRRRRAAVRVLVRVGLPLGGEVPVSAAAAAELDPGLP